MLGNPLPVQGQIGSASRIARPFTRKGKAERVGCLSPVATPAPDEWSPSRRNSGLQNPAYCILYFFLESEDLRKLRPRPILRMGARKRLSKDFQFRSFCCPGPRFHEGKLERGFKRETCSPVCPKKFPSYLFLRRVLIPHLGFNFTFEIF